MREIFRDFLFTKGILVSQPTVEEVDHKNHRGEDALCVAVTLGRKFGIRVQSKWILLTNSMIEDAARNLGQYVPEPFYRGFPESVRQLTPEQLLFDQLFHYFQTYGLGRFEEGDSHSVLEQYERVAFNEEIEKKDFVVMSERDAEAELIKYLNDMCAGKRPLSEQMIDLVCQAHEEPGLHYFPETIGAKNTAVELLVRVQTAECFPYLRMPDVIKIVECILEYRYTTNRGKHPDIRKLNLRNKDRKFIERVINALAYRMKLDDKGCTEIEECFEKREIWKGLLHHIHFKPDDEKARWFAEAIRNPDVPNRSTYSVFERFMKEGCIIDAARVLKQEKGNGALVRNLNYIFSRCKTDEEVKGVLKWLE